MISPGCGTSVTVVLLLREISAFLRPREKCSLVIAKRAVSLMAKERAMLGSELSNECSDSRCCIPPSTSPCIRGCLPVIICNGEKPLSFISILYAWTDSPSAFFISRMPVTELLTTTALRIAFSEPPLRSAMPFCQGAPIPVKNA